MGEGAMGEDAGAQTDTQPWRFQRIRRFPRFRRVIAGGVVVLVVVALVAALATLLWLRPAGQPAQLVSTSGWRTYSDAQHLFSIKAPSSWNVQQDEGDGDSFGGLDGSYSYTGEDMWLGDPPQSADGLGVFIDVVPLTTDFARKWECQAFSPNIGQLVAPRYTLGGVPASFDGGDTWMIETHDAHFQINAHYPEGPQSPHSSPPMSGPEPTPTPVPAGALAAGQREISTALATFSLTNPTPLSC